MTINKSEGKTCADCKEYKLFSEFYTKKGRRDPYLSYCKTCFAIRNRNRYLANQDKYKAQQRLRNKEVKQRVYDAYGNICACCGESNTFFLTIDHVNNDGAEHRRSFGNMGTGKEGGGKGAGLQIYYAIIRENFSERFQILCYNCNCGKQRNGGVCPHKEGLT